MGREGEGRGREGGKEGVRRSVVSIVSREYGVVMDRLIVTLNEFIT